MGICKSTLKVAYEWRYQAHSTLQFSTIVTLRIIMLLCALITSSIGGFSLNMPCDKISFIVGPETTGRLYSSCRPYVTKGTNGGTEVVVEATLNGTNPAEIAASLDISFGVAGWLALWLHAILIEFYVSTSVKLPFEYLLTNLAPSHTS